MKFGPFVVLGMCQIFPEYPVLSTSGFKVADVAKNVHTKLAYGCNFETGSAKCTKFGMNLHLKQLYKYSEFHVDNPMETMEI